MASRPRKRADGRWAASIETGMRPGRDGVVKRTRRYVYGATKRDCERALSVALKELAERTVAPSRQLTGDYLDAWLAGKVSLRDNGRRHYEDMLRLYLRPTIGHIPLADLTADDVQALVAVLVKRGLAPSTVHRVVGVLKTALGRAVRTGRLPANPAAYAELPRIPRREVAVWDAAQVRHCLEVAGDTRIGVYVAVTLSLALRETETLGLRWADLDLVAGEAHIRHRLEGRELVELKTEGSYRILPMSAYLVAALGRWRERQAEQRRFVGRAWRERDLVFTVRHGDAWLARNLRRDFFLLIQRAGLPRITAYELRHVAATHLAARLDNPRELMAYLGHSQIGTTMEIYTRVLSGSLAKAAIAMDGLLGAPEADQAAQ